MRLGKTRMVRRGVVILAGALALSGCGDATSFGGHAASSADATGKEPPPADDPTPTPAPLTSLTWYFQCDKAPATPPAAKSPKDPVVVGAGPFSFSQAQLQSTPITFKGHICPPAQEPRDVVFVIDVSGSMAQGDGPGGVGNDPLASGTCGRLQAIHSVISSIPAGTAKYSLVTFSSDVAAASTGSFAEEKSLFADVAGGDAAKISDVVCAGAGGTNYEAALTKAGQLLAAGRDHATKEIYFVSDGEPSQGEDGIDQAATLKTAGVTVSGDQTPIPVTIATVMLNGTDQVMEKSICSKDEAGKPLHVYAKDSSSLAQALTQLAANGIVSGDVKYAPIGSDKWTSLSLTGHLQGYDFTMPSITIDPKQAPQGLDVVFEYVDKHNDKYSSGGKLLWQESSGQPN